MHSTHIHDVALSAKKQPDCFLCIENESFRLWSRAAVRRHLHQFMVGGVSTNLKIIHTRSLTQNPNKSVPWKTKGAHRCSQCWRSSSG